MRFILLVAALCVMGFVVLPDGGLQMNKEEVLALQVELAAQETVRNELIERLNSVTSALKAERSRRCI